MGKVFIAFIVLLLFSTFAWGFELTPVSRLQPLSPDEQAIEQDIMKYGYPDVATLRYRSSYVLSYDGRNRTPHWVCEHLNADRLVNGEDVARNDCFKEDPSIPVECRSTLSDYKGSGFDRGHMAPAGDNKKTQAAMDDTFFLSNMSPQIGKGFNQAYWKRLEDKIRTWAKERKDLYVYTGPLYIPNKGSDGKKYVKYQVIGINNVAVPTHFFKVLLRENSDGTIDMLSFVLPNKAIDKNEPLSDFIVSVDEIEKLSGLDFFNVLDRSTQDKIEKEKPKVWQ